MEKYTSYPLTNINFVCLIMNYKEFATKPLFAEMFWGTGIFYRYQFLKFLGNSKSSFTTQEDSVLGAIE